MPKISIVMPLYNAEDYVSEAIESVRSQTYEDWELIVIDDCSTDCSRAKVDELAALDSRILVYSNAKNSGAAFTRTAGLKHVSGEYLAFLDADDVWMPEKMEKQIRFMCEEECAMCFTAYQTINSDGTLRNYVSVPDRLDYKGFLKNTITCSHTIMFDLTKVNKDLLAAPQEEFDFSEDLAVWLQVLKTGVVARGLNVPLAKNRKHAISRSANKIKAVKRTWATYRGIEHLDVIHAAYCLIFQLAYAIRKRLR